MIHLHFGVDLCGGVKRVGNTLVVTRFRTVNSVPYWPIESAYAFPYQDASFATTVDGHAPEAFGQTLMPLDRLDVVSVTTAYLRGVSGLLLVVGCISLIPLIMRWTGENLDKFGQAFERALNVCLAIGVTGGCCSYLFCPRTPQRERQIRECCRQAFGIAIDPARLQANYGPLMSREYSRWHDASPDAIDPGYQTRSHSDDPLPRIVECRVQVLCGGPLQELEYETNTLLNEFEASRPN